MNYYCALPLLFLNIMINISSCEYCEVLFCSHFWYIYIYYFFFCGGGGCTCSMCPLCTSEDGTRRRGEWWECQIGHAGWWTLAHLRDHQIDTLIIRVRMAAPNPSPLISDHDTSGKQETNEYHNLSSPLTFLKL